MIPEELRYTSEHEWVRLDGEVATVGITDFAQEALGDIVFVQLPDVGADFAAGDAIGEVESTKSVSEIYAPVAGKVVEVNPALDATPELLNSAPYDEGWLLRVRVAEPESVDALLDATAYTQATQS